MTQPAVVQYALAPLAVELREVAVPDIGDDDALLRVGAVSVCGSDVHQAYNTHSWPVNVPVVLGHEFGGTVAHAGRAVKHFREGDRVVYIGNRNAKPFERISDFLELLDE